MEFARTPHGRPVRVDSMSIPVMYSGAKMNRPHVFPIGCELARTTWGALPCS